MEKIVVEFKNVYIKDLVEKCAELNITGNLVSNDEVNQVCVMELFAADVTKFYVLGVWHGKKILADYLYEIEFKDQAQKSPDLGQG